MVKTRQIRSAAAFGLLSVLALAACAPGQAQPTKTGGTVHVVAVWAASEQDSFMAVLKPFQEKTGIKVQYESTRDLDAVLTTRVQAGNPPEIAAAPSPSTMALFAKQGKLVALNDIIDVKQLTEQYGPDWVKLGQVAGSDKLYTIFSWAAMKGLVWYNPKNFKAKNYQVPKTWDQLMSLQSQIASGGTTPWCIGLESQAASGWPGSDWVKEIVISQSGPDVYDQWYQGKLKWTSPQIKQAWQTWGQILGSGGSNVYGGKQQMLATNFGDAAQGMFQTPPKCYMHNQGSFITDFFGKYPSAPKPVDDFTFFSLPDINTSYASARVVAGDNFAMYKDTPQSRELIKYLISPEAQAIWVKRGGKISPNKKVAISDYPDEISRQIANDLVNAKIARYDAGDLMPSDMRNAYWKGVLDYVSDQSKLDSILADLDKVQATAYKA